MIRTKKINYYGQTRNSENNRVKFFTEQMIVLEFSHAGKSGIILEII